ncbi:TPA: hypothetical protein ACQTXZ_003683 [Pseudomonas aeruginosa]|uniref:hypothetical protein n=1 Tax=Pseudomonas aeruginosa TaxID=287 RepID=UPI0019117156|nr:hypothetical protein [Pseudomonas aeruginosa]MBU8391273.1 hypothetical protein [Pseudomonas aeruginosa]HBO2745077.1 hypothetical protein [Pseudomonas aeruginosa]HCL3570886.1 hypothetical protein [Pseudomonas aeruginosa]HCU2032138.1 hypothetical protein [Pseudomonas aeruginosa]HEK0154375.1 hypothetical protein [Pseudomonas aeruginosa]
MDRRISPIQLLQANNEGELVRQREGWGVRTPARIIFVWLVFISFCDSWAALIFLIGVVRFFNLALPAALLTLVGRNKTPDKPLGALP